MVFRDTLFSRFDLDPTVKEKSIQRFKQLASLSVTEKLSPNTMEVQRMMVNSMALLAKDMPLTQMLNDDSEMEVDQEEEKKDTATVNADVEMKETPEEEKKETPVEEASGEEKKETPEEEKKDAPVDAPVEEKKDTADDAKSVASEVVVASTDLTLHEIVNKFRDAICNRTLDINFRKHLLKNIGPLCNHDAKRAEKIATDMYEKLKDYDQVEFQHILGQALCNLWVTADKLASNCDELVVEVNKTTGIELNVKRNFVVYLHEIVSVEGEKSEVVKSRLLTLQKIFLKFLFDKRASM